MRRCRIIRPSSIVGPSAATAARAELGAGDEGEEVLHIRDRESTGPAGMRTAATATGQWEPRGTGHSRRGAADVLHQVEAREDDVQATFVRSDERTQENADHVGAWRHSARSPSSSGAARAPAPEATAPASAAGAHPKNDDVTAYV